MGYGLVVGEVLVGKSDVGGLGTSMTAVRVYISSACGEETVSGMRGIIFGRWETERLKMVDVGCE
jgi:hypothetical protein